MLRRRRHENPSRAEGGRRTKLHFVALEFTADCEADVYAALADLQVPEGCRMMSVDEDLFYAITDAVGISCSKKARLFGLVSTMLHVANVIKDRAANLIHKRLSLVEEARNHFERRYFWKNEQIRFLETYRVEAHDQEGLAFVTTPGELKEFLDKQIPEPDADAGEEIAQ